jgi:hypothetical protein
MPLGISNDRVVSKGGERVKGFLETLNNFVFPYRYLQDPEYQVSRNLMTWDRMVGKIN